MPLKKLNASLLKEYYFKIIISENFKLRAKALYFYLKKGILGQKPSKRELLPSMNVIHLILYLLGNQNFYFIFFFLTILF